jgi:hypothetical protein
MLVLIPLAAQQQSIDVGVFVLNALKLYGEWKVIVKCVCGRV